HPIINTIFHSCRSLHDTLFHHYSNHSPYMTYDQYTAFTTDFTLKKIISIIDLSTCFISSKQLMDEVDLLNSNEHRYHLSLDEFHACLIRCILQGLCTTKKSHVITISV